LSSTRTVQLEKKTVCVCAVRSAMVAAYTVACTAASSALAFVVAASNTVARTTTYIRRIATPEEPPHAPCPQP
jgi:hypothetical protein